MSDEKKKYFAIAPFGLTSMAEAVVRSAAIIGDRRSSNTRWDAYRYGLVSEINAVRAKLDEIEEWLNMEGLAGGRKGLDDERGNLTLQYVDLCHDLNTNGHLRVASTRPYDLCDPDVRQAGLA